MLEDTSLDVLEDCCDEDDLVLSLNKDAGLAEDDDLLLAAASHDRVSERISKEQQLASEMCSISSLIDDEFDIKQCYRTYSLYDLAMLLLAVKDIEDCSSSLNQLMFGPGCLQEQLHDHPFGQDLNISNFQEYMNLDGAISHFYADLVEVRVSDPLIKIGSLSSSFRLSVKPRYVKLEILLDRLKTSIKRTKSISDFNIFFTQSAVLAGTIGRHDVPENVTISPIGRWTINSNTSLGSSGSMEVTGTSCLELDNYPTTQLPLTEILPVGNQRHGLDPAKKERSNKRNASFSYTGTASSSSDLSTLSSCTFVSKGLLRCIWKGGIPYFVFTVDDQRELYVANPWKVKSKDDKAPSWNYLFYSRVDERKKHNKGSGDMSDLVGRMKVSSSLPPNSNNSNPLNFIETEFVLFGTCKGRREDCVREATSAAPTLRKNKRLQKKALDMFKTSRMSRNDSATRFARFSSEFKDISQGLYPDLICDFDGSSGEDLLADYLPANLELASIVVKGCHHRNNSQKASVGGWGLKFLEKVAMERADTSLRSPIDGSLFSSENCLRSGESKSDLVDSISVLVPAGFHGGPRTRNGGPSSLTDRWRSRGRCDCGGWDVGCPLTVFNSRSSSTKDLSESEREKNCESVSLFIEGGKQGIPALKMVNIHEGLYIIHFESTLSALQSFSIGVAIIHTQIPVIHSKMYCS